MKLKKPLLMQVEQRVLNDSLTAVRLIPDRFLRSLAAFISRSIGAETPRKKLSHILMLFFYTIIDIGYNYNRKRQKKSWTAISDNSNSVLRLFIFLQPARDNRSLCKVKIHYILSEFFFYFCSTIVQLTDTPPVNTFQL